MASTLIPGCHVMSDLLTIREKGVIFALLEAQCKVSTSSVMSLQRVQIYNGPIIELFCMYKLLNQCDNHFESQDILLVIAFN